MQHYNVNDLCSPNRELMERTFNSIYDKYSFLVFYVAFEIVRHKEDAEDITDETFLRMYENRKSLKKSKNLKYYLVTIAKNLAINLQKSKSRYVAYDDTIDSGQKETHDDFDLYIMTFKEFLDEEEISLVVYKFLYEYTFKEIAAIKKVTINSVSSKYKRTLDKIRKYYGR
ncbi:MAG TPA: sigma-70 family RNA polymerase sigma factor [Candidatus Paceibacterota bacterium]|nr:sigma-70 family RNA polymerase sigma factor [Candidatus Paceibacterota bacterium]